MAVVESPEIVVRGDSPRAESSVNVLLVVQQRGTAANCRNQRVINMRPYVITILLLTCSNVFMTFAWYAHLRNLSARPWFIAVLVSWGIAFLEYVLQVPANRTGISVMQLGQLKILQEVIALSVFVPFAVLYMKQRLTLDYLWASLCIAGAAYFMFRRG
ncbi:MAG: DMT family protein [Planctomycetaceae bacterium]|nr:DMT family protein [Planctomycetaceae bacterium]